MTGPEVGVLLFLAIVIGFVPGAVIGAAYGAGVLYKIILAERDRLLSQVDVDPVARNYGLLTLSNILRRLDARLNR